MHQGSARAQATHSATTSADSAIYAPANETSATPPPPPVIVAGATGDNDERWLLARACGRAAGALPQPSPSPPPSPPLPSAAARCVVAFLHIAAGRTKIHTRRRTMAGARAYTRWLAAVDAASLLNCERLGRQELLSSVLFFAKRCTR